MLRVRQLFVTGRLKNLIIIRGRNYYPEDIEQTINAAYAGLRVGYCAAFSVEVDDHDQLVVVQEVEPRHRDLDVNAAIQAIRSAIAIRHELEVYDVVLVKAGAVPKTSSGKTRRAACREGYLRGELEIIAAWKSVGGEAESASDDAVAMTPRQASAAEIESWLVERITARLRLPPGDVKVTTPFLELEWARWTRWRLPQPWSVGWVGDCPPRRFTTILRLQPWPVGWPRPGAPCTRGR